MHIVAVQFNMAWEDKATNHRRLRELLESQSIPAGSLIMVPEMFETGFSMNPRATAQSESREGETLLRDLARQFDSAVMGGVSNPADESEHPDPSSGSALVDNRHEASEDTDAFFAKNECVVFAPDGTELVRYQKMRPFSLSGEGNHYRAGNSHRIFTWQGVKIAPYICYDLRFPEIFRSAVAEGAELITLIACWPAKRSEHWVRLLQARAIENLAPTIGVNRCGNEPGLAFDGRSCAFDHMGVEIFQASDQEQVIQFEIDIEASRRWRSKFPALRDMDLTS